MTHFKHFQTGGLEQEYICHRQTLLALAKNTIQANIFENTILFLFHNQRMKHDAPSY